MYDKKERTQRMNISTMGCRPIRKGSAVSMNNCFDIHRKVSASIKAMTIIMVVISPTIDAFGTTSSLVFNNPVRFKRHPARSLRWMNEPGIPNSNSNSNNNMSVYSEEEEETQYGTNGIMCVINFRVVMGKQKTNGVGAYFATPLPLYIYL